MNTFWDEFEEFKERTGPFSTAYIWNGQNNDLRVGKSHLWHKKKSLCSTKVLGKFACRVCSKIVGMGSAERNWGDVKYLKSVKRSHLSSDAVEKQATIFGATCMYDAALERQKAQENSSDPYKFWDEEDFDREFDMLEALPSAQVRQPTTPRFVKCYLEEWEDECVRKNTEVNSAKLLRKYGGLEFDDLDNLHHHYRIDSNEMFYHRKSGWCVKAYKNGEEEYTPWTIDKEEALHECLAVFY